MTKLLILIVTLLLLPSCAYADSLTPDDAAGYVAEIVLGLATMLSLIAARMDPDRPFVRFVTRFFADLSEHRKTPNQYLRNDVKSSSKSTLHGLVVFACCGLIGCASELRALKTLPWFVSEPNCTQVAHDVAADAVDSALAGVNARDELAALAKRHGEAAVWCAVDAYTQNAAAAPGAEPTDAQLRAELFLSETVEL